MKNKSLKCSQIVRNIPLERYRLPADGRKWMQVARSRSELLVRLSTYANGDGTFVGENGINYSPSFETLEKHIARKSFYRLSDALRDTGLLSWTREKHYERRIYTIHLDQVPLRPKSGVKLDAEQVSDSPEPSVTADGNDSNQVSHWPESGATRDNHPSLPSKELHPSNLPAVVAMGGRQAGEKNLSEAKATAAGKEILLTEDEMRERLQKTHLQRYNNRNNRKGDEGWCECQTIPRTPNLTGCKELFDELRKHDITRLDQMNLVCLAYESWFESRYLLSFEEKEDARDKATDRAWNEKHYGVVSRTVYVPEPIRCPLVMFRKEIGVYLDEAREQQDEEVAVIKP